MRDYIREALDLGSKNFSDKKDLVMPVRRKINAYIKEYWCEDKEDRYQEKRLYDEMCLACGEEVETSLTTEQWSAAFDAMSKEIINLEEALEQYPHAQDFIKRKISLLNEILEIIGPLSV